MFSIRREKKNAPTGGKPEQGSGGSTAEKDGRRKAYVTGSCHYDPSRPCLRKTESGCWSCEYNRSLF